MTNKQVNFSELKREYDQNSQVLIHDFAEHHFAESIYQSIKSIPKENWDHNFFPETHNSELVKTIPALDSYKAFIQLAHKLSHLEYKKGNFSYSFQKPSYKRDENVLKIYSKFEEFIKEETFQKLITTVTQVKNPKLESWFISKYTKGDFLSRHNDKTNGKIGFVYYLSKKWENNFGGDLKFFLKGTNENVFSYSPGFNKLLLFKIESTPPLSHEVFQVKEDAERIAISGWMN